MNSTLVVLPTYNEVDNIERLVSDINAIGLPLDILVIDDNSPDGTGDRVERLSRTMRQVTLIRRPARGGLGSAYAEGYAYALENDYQFLVQMDADYSHHPRYLKDMLNLALSHDVVLGSRYINGGGTSGWPRRRVFLSRLGNAYARTTLGLPYADITSGYRVFSREALSTLCACSLRAGGFGVQIESLYRLHRAGARIIESPIIFSERHTGVSKLNARIVGEAIALCVTLRID